MVPGILADKHAYPFTDRQTDRQTDTLDTILHYRTWDGVKITWLERVIVCRH